MPDATSFRALAYTLTLAVAGCGRSATERLAGRWVGERIDVEADQLASATGWVKGTSFEFRGDQLTVTVPAETPRKGIFKVARTEGPRLLVSVARQDGSGATDEASVSFDGENRLRWDIGHGREVVLVRAQ